MANISDVIGGLQILQKYVTSKSRGLVDAQHDIICAGPELSQLKDTMTPEDKAKMDEFGWHEDEESDSWAKFT
jgi:hypothetical protein